VYTGDRPADQLFTSSPRKTRERVRWGNLFPPPMCNLFQPVVYSQRVERVGPIV
jgi:hypothetical protein